ncbi:hypothetical protein [Halorhodospira neutriphila]|uniref:TonB-dependent receptor-like beta-barrel domain-containing protein n=1 Tax=Halorhodospira neutriphila TaxID=168379 RepID=A0ABS1E3Y3_9GAMM|nr:hypothetical protein [Halorhodospira neutriphila]MBK1725927.1 hypothetical protein [Halorhodospira neutriphila]
MAGLIAAVGDPGISMAAQTERLIVGLRQTHLWDSNFDRVQEGSSEQQRTTTLTLGARPRLGPHRMMLRGRLSRLRHQRRQRLDATVVDYTTQWEGPLLLHGLTGRAQLRQREQTVDRLAFTEGGVVTRRRQRAALSYGSDPAGWHAQLRGTWRQTRYDSSTFRDLNLDDQATSVALTYISEQASRIGLRATRGKRTFPDESEPRASALDFDYRQLALEIDWRMTDKTHLQGQLRYFSRDGEINDGSGSDAELRLHWQATAQTALSSRVSLRKPSTGEDPNDLSEVLRYRLAAAWHPGEKWQLRSAAAYERRHFRGGNALPEREDDITEWTPLDIAYAPIEAVIVSFATKILKRNSPKSPYDLTAQSVTASVEANF